MLGRRRLQSDLDGLTRTVRSRRRCSCLCKLGLQRSAHTRYLSGVFLVSPLLLQLPLLSRLRISSRLHTLTWPDKQACWTDLQHLSLHCQLCVAFFFFCCQCGHLRLCPLAACVGVLHVGPALRFKQLERLHFLLELLAAPVVFLDFVVVRALELLLDFGNELCLLYTSDAADE